MPDYAISTWIVDALPLDEAIAVIADAGFRAVEISGGTSPLLLGWEADPVGVRQKLDAAGVDVPSVHCPRAGRVLDAEDAAERQASVAANVQYFEWMRDCGIPEIVIHPTSGVDVSTDAKRAAARERSLESLKALAGPAADMGVSMAVENLGRDGRPGSFMADLVDMIDGLGEHVGLCHDVGHSQQAALDVLGETKAALAAGKLFSLHLHDVLPDNVDHFVPGEGVLDLPALIAELNAASFAGLRTLEVKPPESDVVGRVQQVAAVKDEWAGMGAGA